MRAGDGVGQRLDRDPRQRVGQLRFAASDQPDDVRAGRRQLERGDRGLKFDDRTVLDRAGDAVGDFDATLFIGRHVADRRARTREQRRVAEFVVELTAVEAAAADEIDEPVGDVETNPNAGRRRASVIAEREGGLDRYSRFQLALGRNDKRPQPLRQRRCSRRKNLRKRSHDAGTFRRRQRRSRARARRALQCF